MALVTVKMTTPTLMAIALMMLASLSLLISRARSHWRRWQRFILRAHPICLICAVYVGCMCTRGSIRRRRRCYAVDDDSGSHGDDDNNDYDCVEVENGVLLPRSLFLVSSAGLRVVVASCDH